MKKKIQKLWRKASSKISKMGPKSLPRMEDVLFMVFIVFSTFMGGALLIAHEQIKKDDFGYVAPEPIVINEEVRAMVAGTPMERMVPYLSQQDEKVASFLVAIAKKESNWGKFSPKKDGEECFNYWGYRGKYNKTASGYTCFRSPHQAVEVVGDRLAELISQEIDTPREMIVWKCGRSCDGHDPYAVGKWISDVDYYYRKLYN